MAHYATGLDRAKLQIVAEAHKINIAKYMPLIDEYEMQMLKQQNKES